jgi:hypothetical protein
MKHVYALAAIVLAMLIFSYDTSAQVYTAVVSGNWSVTGASTPWDPSGGKPPENCLNCTITVNSGVTLTLDAHVTLTGVSTFKIGNDGSAPAQLLIPAAAGGSTFANSNNIILSSASGDLTTLRLAYTNSTVDASGAGERDGVFSFNSGYLKQIGNGPWSGFLADGSEQFKSTIQGGSFATGVKTINGFGTLPVVLLDFSATSADGVVELNWTTAQESNSDHFAVLRSTDNGGHWQILGNVAAQGYSSSPFNYSFSDQSPASGVNEYRLLSVDRDGKSGYSITKVVRTNLISGVSIYPNPAKDYVNVSIGSEMTSGASIRLMNQAGQTLAEKKLNGAAGTTVTLPVSTYPQGNYLILVTAADGSKQINKLFISRQ